MSILTLLFAAGLHVLRMDCPVTEPEEGFVLEGEYRGEKYRIHRQPAQTNSLHVEYDFVPLKSGDFVDISTENDSFYCRPTQENVITKLGFATEELYLMSQRKKAKV